MDDEPTKQWVRPYESPKLVALRKALADLDIEYAIGKRDKNLVSLHIWIGEDK